MTETIVGNSHKTAMSRNKPSAPMVRLKAAGRLVGRVLDYGCGKGYDASHFGTHYYDPHFAPVMPHGTFDTITCNFVLNVVECPEAREAIVQDVLSRLNDGGRAYFTVRTDKKRLNGYTSTGSWQGHIVLNMPIVSRGSGFITYCKSKG
jgi:hypothetical protein